MYNFVFPASFKKNQIKLISEINKNFKNAQVKELFGALPSTLIASGRFSNTIPKTNMSSFVLFINFAKENKINFAYTLNTACLSGQECSKEKLKGILRFVEQLYEKGVDRIIVALPPLIELISSQCPDIKISASSWCDIDTTTKAKEMENLGADRIILPTNLSRNFEAIRNIRENIKIDLEIIVNSGCFLNCPVKKNHENFYSHSPEIIKIKNKEKVLDPYFKYCFQKKLEEPTNMLKLAWVRPENLWYYKKLGIDYFKIAGRERINKMNQKRMLHAYLSEKYSGNLLKLMYGFSNHPIADVYDLPNESLDNFFVPFLKGQGCEPCNLSCDYCQNNSSLVHTNEKMKQKLTQILSKNSLYHTSFF